MAIKICEPNIKLADNGFIVCYRAQETDPDKTYDYSSQYKELVYPLEKKNEAIAKFIELGVASGKLKADTKSSEEESEGE